MSARGRTFVIVGAGVAGLTLALSLAKFGATVIVLERNTRIQEFGAGLQISPNARRILDRLGLHRQISARSFEPEAIDIYAHRRERPLASIRLGEFATERFGTPYAVMHRADLVEVLHTACKRFANIDILFGVRDFDLTTHARGITLIVEEYNGASRRLRPFAVIGADGVHSRIRTEWLEGPKAKYSGYSAWRAMIDLADLPETFAKHRTSLIWGPGFHAVLYPLPHRLSVNIAMFARVRRADAQPSEIPEAIRLPVPARKDTRLAALLDTVGDNWTKWPLYAVETKKWVEDGIGLIGDAAHAMLPYQAQGAAMAIEDAAILAPLLITEPTPDQALSRYVGLRQKRDAKVSALSAKNGRIFHMRRPFSVARNLVVSLTTSKRHLQRLAWIYDYDPAPEPAIPLPPKLEKTI